MIVTLTAHAQRRLRERKISILDIEEALGSVQVSGPADDGDTKYTGPVADRRLLTVVLLAPGLSGFAVRVKSAFWERGGGGP
jgi:hypothetical protein